MATTTVTRRAIVKRKEPQFPIWLIVAIAVSAMFAGSVGLAVVGMLVFKGKTPQNAPAVAVEQTVQPQPKIVTSNKPAIPTEWTKICNEYKDNMVSADMKYKGNRVVFECGPNGTVQKVDGKPCVGYCNIANIRGPQPESTICLFFRDTSDIAKFDGKSAYRVEGTVSGRVDDGIYRLIRGFEFHIDIVDCVILEKIQQR